MRGLRVVLIAALGGCGYTSSYAPPVDGRARPVWVRDHLENNLGDVTLPPGCLEALHFTVHPETPRPAAAPRDYWTPVASPVTPGPPRALADGGEAFGDHVELVVAAFIWPALGVVLAAWRAESSPASVEAIDRSNAYNDLARVSGNPCSWRR